MLSCSSPPPPTAPDRTPVAEAGSAQTVTSGQLVTLDGSGSSDPLQRALSYRWEPGADNPGSVGVLTATAVVQFSPQRPGTYTFFLTVTADGQVSTADSVTITVLDSDNSAPVADAGPDLDFSLDEIIHLDGSTSSDDDGDSLSFLWRLIAGEGTVTLLDSTAAQTSFTATVAGDYVFVLLVSDSLATASDEVTIGLLPADNIRPVAIAGVDTVVTVGAELTLDGSASSDPDGDNASLVYAWTVSAPDGVQVTLSDQASQRPSFTPPEEGEYIIALTVTDTKELVSLRNQITVDALAQIYEKRGGMIEIPDGPFMMGTVDGLADESPPHIVSVSTFWIDEFEVTASQYQVCVDAGSCDEAGLDVGCNANLPGMGDHPINCVDWAQVSNFCSWAGKRLPSEAEWEKAARGTDERRFPWGHTAPQPDRLNYNDLFGSTVEVGLYDDGASFYGVHNMAGNVQEWTADYYASDYYSIDPTPPDPRGPASGDFRVVRGGNWKLKINLGDALFTTTIRGRFRPDDREDTVGFRCSRNDPP